MAVTGRVFQMRRVWRLEPGAFTRAAILIADAERAGGAQVVIGVERGGRSLAEALADQLDLPLAAIRARHNHSDAITLPATGRVSVDARAIAELAPGGGLLVVDDICGSGATLRAVVAELGRVLVPAAVRTAVRCRNIGAGFESDTWVWDVADWVCFPWEGPPHAPTEPLPAPAAARCR